LLADAHRHLFFITPVLLRWEFSHPVCHGTDVTPTLPSFTGPLGLGAGEPEHRRPGHNVPQRRHSALKPHHG